MGHLRGAVVLVVLIASHAAVGAGDCLDTVEGVIRESFHAHRCVPLDNPAARVVLELGHPAATAFLDDAALLVADVLGLRAATKRFRVLAVAGDGSVRFGLGSSLSS